MNLVVVNPKSVLHDVRDVRDVRWNPSSGEANPFSDLNNDQKQTLLLEGSCGIINLGFRFCGSYWSGIVLSETD